MSLHATGLVGEPRVDVPALVKHYGCEGIDLYRDGPDLVAVHDERRVTLTLEGKGLRNSHDATVQNQLDRAFSGVLKYYARKRVGRLVERFDAANDCADARIARAALGV